MRRRWIACAAAALFTMLPVLSAEAAAPAVAPLQTVLFVTPQEGFAGGQGVIWRTVDGGATWQDAYRGTVSVREFSFATAMAGIAVGDGAILQTDDGGRTWLRGAEPGGSGTCRLGGRPCIVNAVLTGADSGLAVAAPLPALGTEPSGILSTVAGQVLVANQSGRVNEIEATSGRIGASLAVPYMPMDMASLGDGEVAVATASGLDLVRMSLPRIVRHLPGGYCSVAFSGGRIFAQSFDVDSVAALDRSGRMLWQATGSMLPCGMAVGGGVVYVDESNAVVGLSAATGKQVKHFAVNVPGPMALSPDGRILYVAEALTSQLVAIDTASGRVVAARPDDGIAGLALGQGGKVLYVASGGHSPGVLALSAGDLHELWTTGLPQPAQALAVDPSGDLVYASLLQLNAVAEVGTRGQHAVRVIAAGGVDIDTRAGLPIPLPGGRLLSTQDGGRTWRPLSTPAEAQSACGSASGTLWAAGGPVVMRSLDRGATWHTVFQAPLHRGVAWAADMQCGAAGTAYVLFVGEDVGLCHQAYALYRTTDDGANWRMVAEEGYMADYPVSPAVPAIGSYPGPIAVFGHGQAMLAASMCASQIASGWTDDAGGTWSTATRPLPTAALAAAFAGAGTVWLVPAQANGPVLWRVTERGRRWQEVRP